VEKANNLNFFLALVVITAIFAMGCIRMMHLPDEQLRAGEWVTHTREVLQRLETLSLHISQAETDQRDYILLGNPAYQSLYKTTVSQIGDDLKNFQYLTQDNSVQQTRVPSLKRNIDSKLAELRKDSEALKGGESAKIFRTLSDNHDAALTSQIDKQIAEMKSEEESLLQSRLHVWYLEASQTQKSFIAGGVLLYMIVCSMCGVLYSMALQRKKLLMLEQDAAAIQRSKAEHLEKIMTIQRSLVGHALDMQEIMKTIVGKTQELIGAEGSIIEMLEGDKMVYHAASGTGAPHVGLKLDVGNSFSGLCIRENAVLKCDDSETDARVDRMACRKVGLRSMIGVPLRHQGNAIGVLKVISSKAGYFSDEHINTLELIAGLLSAALSDAITANNMRLNNLELKAVNVDLEKLATTDGLTGLLNHRTFQNNLSREHDLAIRHGKSLSVLLLDVDHFKEFNDSFGHPAGDVVLKRISLLLKQIARSTDYVARYGGEEFVLVLPETPMDKAITIATRIQQTVASDKWKHRPVTVSVGVSSLGKGVANAAELVKRADKALYAAKEKGRNCVVQSEA
jgi:diguanylate cyclase (GGDEF)-like protein